MSINLALAEGRFDDALQEIVAVMALQHIPVAEETLTLIAALAENSKTWDGEAPFNEAPTG